MLDKYRRAIYIYKKGPDFNMQCPLLFLADGIEIKFTVKQVTSASALVNSTVSIFFSCVMSL